MKKGLTEIVFILDRSGSMSGLESDTIGGFNSLLKNSVRKMASHLFLRFSLMIRVRSSMTECRWRRWQT